MIFYLQQAERSEWDKKTKTQFSGSCCNWLYQRCKQLARLRTFNSATIHLISLYRSTILQYIIYVHHANIFIHVVCGSACRKKAFRLLYNWSFHILPSHHQASKVNLGRWPAHRFAEWVETWEWRKADFSSSLPLIHNSAMLKKYNMHNQNYNIKHKLKQQKQRLGRKWPWNSGGGRSSHHLGPCHWQWSHNAMPVHIGRKEAEVGWDIITKVLYTVMLARRTTNQICSWILLAHFMTTKSQGLGFGAI